MSKNGTTLTFPAGLAGYPELKRFRIHEPPKGYPLKFFHSLDDETFILVCMDVSAMGMDYEVPLSDEQATLLDLEKPEDALVLVSVSVPADPRQMTANLALPLVINTVSGLGQQVELPADQYSVQHPVFSRQEDVIISFPKGLIGFQEIHSFRLFEPKGGYPLKFLQAVDRPEISFTCLDVVAIKPDYEFQLGSEDAASLALEKPEDAMVLALVVIPENPRQMTANLAGPVVLNVQARTGRQIVLNTEKYPLQYHVFPDMRQGGEC